jgi:hypothetical protein
MKAKPIDGGKICPKCERQMQRFEHKPEWKPKPNQKYYFTYWDICKPCRYIKNYGVSRRSSFRHPNYLP